MSVPNMHLISDWLKDLSALFYPTLCPGCFEPIASANELICGFCEQQLPRTGFAPVKNNPTEKTFFGRLPVEAAHSECYFSKGHTVQRLMHQLKYKNNRKAGEWMGNLLGESLLQSGRFHPIDLVVPLPMEKSKERKRGYNQAEVIAGCVASKLNATLKVNAIIKTKKTESQTKKSRTDRWLNMRHSFILQEKESFLNKNILLVDDVITTGATLEACGHQILSARPQHLFIATFATAEK